MGYGPKTIPLSCDIEIFVEYVGSVVVNWCKYCVQLSLTTDLSTVLVHLAEVKLKKSLPVVFSNY